MQADGPDAWMAAMRRGEFARAWTISDRILARRVAACDFDHSLPRHLQSIWDGRSLTGKHVLVRCYHGLGDTIQFIRFAKPLHAIAREVSVWVQPELMPLIEKVDGVDRVLPLHEGTPDLLYDADIEVMELAHALRATPRDLIEDVTYIRRPERNMQFVSGGPLRVGLIWGAGMWAPERSLRLSELAPLFQVSGIEPIALQRGPAAQETQLFPLRDCGDDNIETFAATLAALDLLISVDTFGTHLAGAMGLPVWVMLPAACDWRWMSTGRTSLWYPSMRLYRQTDAGDWTPVVAEIARDLAGYAAHSIEESTSEQSHRCDVRSV